MQSSLADLDGLSTCVFKSVLGDQYTMLYSKGNGNGDCCDCLKNANLLKMHNALICLFFETLSPHVAHVGLELAM